MTDKTGGPAFPTKPTAKLNPFSHTGELLHVPDSNGMTLRDYFAAKMLAGDTANSHETGGSWPNHAESEALLERARLYSRMADAMLKAREQ